MVGGRWAAAAAIVALAAACLALTGSARGTGGLPLVGVNYAHVSLAGCDFTDRGIIRNGNAYRPLIAQQLAAMRASGIEALRMIVWNMHDATGQRWGVVDSAGGRLRPAARNNLAWFLTQVRKDGFKEFEAAFSPQWTNDPDGWPTSNWDPSLFNENWRFIQDVRSVVKRYGPPITHFDLLNEGAPSDYAAPIEQQLEDYIAQMYTRYVNAYGNGDVTVSTIGDAADQTRLANLIDVLRSTGKPLPTWFEIHPYVGSILATLQAIDATMAAKGVTEPISVGETYYDDQEAADDISAFVGSSSRSLTEALSWPDQRGDACSSGVSPPYRAEKLIGDLTGAPPPSTLAATASVSGATLKTPYGARVTALEAGDWTVSVTVSDRRTQFALSGPGVSLSTAAGFVGTVQWPVTLAAGTYTYRRTGRPGASRGGTFVVLTPG